MCLSACGYLPHIQSCRLSCRQINTDMSINYVSNQINIEYRIIYIASKLPQNHHAPVTMQITQQSTTQAEQDIKKMLINIQNITVQMSNTFEQAILKHEQQFIKTYRIKITQLTKLFEDLTKVLEDKFINNALTNRLNIVMKERDYFKYQCLKLNVQYQTVLAEQTSLTGQIVNVTDQMKIYKHLLEDQKLKNKQLEKNADKFKCNFNEMAYKTLTQTIENVTPNSGVDHKLLEKKNKKINMVLSQLQEKNQLIRNLKMKMSELELVVNQRQIKYFEKKQLYETFKACVNSWKRDVITKERKNINTSYSEKRVPWNPQKLTVASKKQLLKYLFTSSQFLKFIEQLIFNPNFKVEFTETTAEGDKYMVQNRIRLFDYMRKKKVICSPNIGQR